MIKRKKNTDGRLNEAEMTKRKIEGEYKTKRKQR